MSTFQPLTGLYEPSAIVQLADGRFLVVEDEKAHPFSLVSISLQGKVSRSALTPGFFESTDGYVLTARLIAGQRVVALQREMNLEKAVNHGEHNEHGGKTRTCTVLTNHPTGEP